MRLKNSIRDGIVDILLNLISIVLGLVSQAFFIRILGAEYNGIKGLFSNIFSMLAIAELGFGSAIIYNLYKPVSNNDIEKIKSLVNYYKKVYRVVAIIILVLGICIIPLLPIIVGETHIKDNIYLIYGLFLIETVLSYLLTYKRSIAQASQKNYLINLVRIIFLITVNIIQILILVLTKNFIIYLITKIIVNILENLTINYVIGRKYPYIKDKNYKELDKSTKSGIYKNVKGLLFHKIGSFIVMGTDNILISMLLGITQVGLYTNYYTVANYVNILFGQIFSTVTASIGNLLIKDKERSHQIYKNMLFLNSWVYCFCSISIYCLMEPFITIWIGKQFILPKLVLIMLCLNFYVQGMRKTNCSFKDAAGIFYEDRFIPILESIVNIVASIILAKFFGLAGIIMGTAISSLVLYMFSFPKYMYKKVFNKSYWEFYKIHVYYLGISLITCIITAILVANIKVNNAFITLIINGIICLVVPNAILYLVSKNKEEFKYFKNIIKSKMIEKFNRKYV